MGEIQVQDTPAPMRPREYSGSQLQLVKRTVAKDCNDDEFNMFIEIAKRQGLDPFRKQIYAFVFNKDDATKRQFVTVTGIDGYRAIAKRTGTYRPSDHEPAFEIDEALKDPDSNPAGIVKATIIIYQFGPDRQWYPIVGTARWAEFAPLASDGHWEDILDKDGKPVLETSGRFAGKAKRRKVPNGKARLTKENWRTMPFVMIGKCAEAQALRKGWPEEYGNIYVFEELDRAQADMTATEALAEHEKEQRLIAVNGKDSYPMIMTHAIGIEMVGSGEIADRVLEHVSSLGTSSEIDAWMGVNRIGLQQYWAKEKADALELKRRIEKVQAEKPKFQTDIQG